MAMITEKQYRILQLIDQDTTWAGSERPGFELTGYFIPKYYHWSSELKDYVNISGPGDAAIIRSLFKAGLARSYAKEIHPYAAVITENGMVALEEYRQQHVYTR